MILLEAIIALTVLAVVGSAAIWSTSEALRGVARVHEREAQVRRASNLLTAVSLWSRDELDQHLGNRRQGDLLMRIDRPDPTLYEVTLLDGASRQHLLGTLLYRKVADR